jgi:hypothetical protein
LADEFDRIAFRIGDGDDDVLLLNLVRLRVSDS